MSTELENLAEVSLSVLAGLECGFEGGPIGPDGHCSMKWHAHCPFCGENLGCQHQVARWDDLDCVGLEFPPPPWLDEAISGQSLARLRELLSDLAPLWDVYTQHRNDVGAGAQSDLLMALSEILDLKVVAVEWGQNTGPCAGGGTTFFAPNGTEVRTTIKGAAARVQEAFFRLEEELAEIAEEEAERALGILAQEMCEYTDLLINRAAGYCGIDGSFDETHTHCPFCGSGDECPHLLAQWNDDFGYSGPDLPLVPEEWDIPADWTDDTLRKVLGDLQPAFLAYAENQDNFDVFWELTALVESVVHRVSWCGDGMGAGIGVVCHAADAQGATTQLRLLAGQLEAAIAKLGALRQPQPVGSDEVDR